MLPLSLPPNGGWAEIGACPRSSSSLLSLRRHRGYTDVFTRGRTPWGLLRHPQGGHWSLVKRHFRNVGFVNFLTFHAQTIQNRHFVIIPRIRAAQGTSDGCNFGERERVTEQVRRDYTKCLRFCLICVVKGFCLWRRRASRRRLRRSQRV